jgi:hypothetical protein
MNLSKRDRVILLVCAAIAFISIYFLNDPRLLLNSSRFNQDSIGRIVQLDRDVRTKNIGTYFWNDAEQNGNISPGLSLFTGEKSTSTVEFKDGKKIKISENSLVKFSVSKNEIVLDFSFGEISAQGISKKIKIVICDKTYEIEPNRASAFAIKKTSECGRLNVRVQKGEIKLNNKKLTPAKEFIQPARTELRSAEVEVIPAPPPTVVIATEPVEIPEPVVTPTPPPVVEMPAPELKSKILKHSVINKKPPLIEWGQVENAVNYQVQTSYTKDFTKLSSATVPNTQFGFAANPSRKIFYRARGIKENGEFGPFSEIGEIEPLYPKIELSNKEQSFLYQAKNSQDNGGPRKFELAWTSVPNADQYEVEISKTTDFKKVGKVRSREPSTVLTAPSTGKFHWRVSALSKGKTISRSNDFGTVDYAKVFNLNKPDVPNRYKNSSFFFQKTAARFIWISWVPVNVGEPTYKVELSAQPDFNSIIKTYSSPKTTMLIRDQIPEGLYYWRVRAEVEGQVSDWSETAQFKILTGGKRNTATEQPSN